MEHTTAAKNSAKHLNIGEKNGVLCRSDCAERIVSSFANQIKSEYYGGNRYLSIEGIVLENLSASNQKILSLKSETVSHQAVFHLFLSDESKKYAAKKPEHSKNIM